MITYQAPKIFVQVQNNDKIALKIKGYLKTKSIKGDMNSAVLDISTKHI